MNACYSTKVETDFGKKQIEVYSCSVTDFEEDVDVLLTSAFVGSYEPTPRTVFAALDAVGISVEKLAKRPAFDLRTHCNTWLSEDISDFSKHIRRIGCVELNEFSTWDMLDNKVEQEMINSIRTFFNLLDIAGFYGIKTKTLALPLLGSGSQHIAGDLMIVPLVNECVSLLRRNADVQRICFIEKSEEKAEMIATYLESSYHLRQNALPQNETPQVNAMTFISYSSKDKNVADNLCAKLEASGMRAWYAPRDVRGAYADAIVRAIESCTHFVVILSENSMKSQHVLNEIDLAFQRLPNDIKFKPLRIDDATFAPAFKYYLSRQHWMDALVPPLEDRLNEFVKSILLEK